MFSLRRWSEVVLYRVKEPLYVIEPTPVGVVSSPITKFIKDCDPVPFKPNLATYCPEGATTESLFESVVVPTSKLPLESIRARSGAVAAEPSGAVPKAKAVAPVVPFYNTAEILAVVAVGPQFELPK